MSQVGALLKAQIELATAEIRADVSAEIGAAKGLGLAALAGIAALLVTVVLALALVPAWLAGLIVTVALALIALVAGAAGWRRRVRNPVRRTKKVGAIRILAHPERVAAPPPPSVGKRIAAAAAGAAVSIVARRLASAALPPARSADQAVGT